MSSKSARVRPRQADQRVAAVDRRTEHDGIRRARVASTAARRIEAGKVGLSALTRIAPAWPARADRAVAVAQTRAEIALALQQQAEARRQQRAQRVFGPDRRIDGVAGDVAVAATSSWMVAARSRMKQADSARAFLGAQRRRQPGLGKARQPASCRKCRSRRSARVAPLVCICGQRCTRGGVPSLHKASRPHHGGYTISCGALDDPTAERTSDTARRSSRSDRAPSRACARAAPCPAGCAAASRS